MMDRIIPGALIALTVAFVLAILIASARGEPKNRWDRDHEIHHELGWPDLASPSVACPDQQTLDESRRCGALAIVRPKQSPGAPTTAAPCCVDALGRLKDRTFLKRPDLRP